MIYEDENSSEDEFFQDGSRQDKTQSFEEDGKCELEFSYILKFF